MNFKENFIELFAFTRGERKGILIAFILLSVLIAYRFVHPLLQTVEKDKDLPFKDRIEALAAQLKKDSIRQDDFTFNLNDDKLVDFRKLFPFDPNTIDDDTWSKLGMHKGQIRSIRNFLHKGGQFRVKKDLAKMYVISEEEYQRLYPYILLPEEQHAAAQSQTPFEPSKPFAHAGGKTAHFKVEINSADSFDFRKLKGIGPYLSRKIIAYRDKLGGFYSATQLKEIYHMDPLRIDSLSAQLITDTSLVKKININKIDAQSLSLHPYLSRQQARGLIAYRDQHGPFGAVSDIRKSVLIDEKTYQKIAPYLTVD